MIGFCHLPKTGGTSLVQGMRNAGMNVWVPTPPEGVEPWNVTEWNQQPPKGTDVVAGHIAAGTFDQFPVDEWVTVVRHPVVRWISHLYWINRNRTTRWNIPPSDLMSDLFWHPTDGWVNGISVTWLHAELDQAAKWFGVELPAERHKATGRPDPIPADLWAAAAAANRLDLALWEWWIDE